MVFTIALATGCSTLQPPDPNGPGTSEPQYPLAASAEADARDDALLAWRQLAQRYSISTRADITLDPLTATVSGLPTNLSAPIVLPKVGAGSTQTEEEIRESLRRFINEWRTLIGADPNELSLVERVDESANVKIARYEQRPFRYPLRGDYGTLIIRFDNNRQLISISSSCLRDTEQLENVIADLTPSVSAEDVADLLRGKSLTVPNNHGEMQTLSLPANQTSQAKQLVIYALPSRTRRDVLHLRLAWEVETPGAPVKLVYLDAISSEVIAVSA